MIEIVRTIIDSIRQYRGRKQITKQFVAQGFTEIDCPSIHELLPLRFPEIVNDQNVCMFAKGDSQMLVVPARFLPRTRLPHRPRTFVLLCTSLADNPLAADISAAIRDPRENYSIVDQLAMDSYPSISPLPYTLFAADDESAKTMLEVVEISEKQQPTGSIIVHAGRLLAQVSD